MKFLRELFLASAGVGEATRAGRNKQLLVMSVAFLLLALIIGVFSSGFWLINLTAAYATMLALMGSNLLFGQLGLVSLCQFALVGVGGWITLRLHHAFGLPFEMNMLLAGVLTAAIGVLWGLPALRFRGIFLALVTLMLSGAFQTFVNAVGFPGGGSGIFGNQNMGGKADILMARPPLMSGDHGYFAYVVVVALLGLILVEMHRRSKPGRAWALIQKDARVAAASGVSISLYQAWAFALSGFLAGVAGTLLAGLYGQLDSSIFPASESILLFAGSVLSGTTNWYGAAIGGLLVRVVPTLMTDFGVTATYSTMVFGIGLILAVVGPPNGLAGMIDRLADRLSERKNPK